MSAELRANKIISGIPELAAEIKAFHQSVKDMLTILKQGVSTFEKQSKSQADLAKKTKATKEAVSNLTALEKERIRIANQTKATFAKSLSLQEKGTKTLLKGKIKLREEQKKLNDQLKSELGVTKKSGGLWKTITKGVVAANVAMAALRIAWRAVSGAIKDSVKTNSLFSKGMDEVKAITKATSTEFTALYDNALLLGATTAKSAIEISKLQKEFAKLGFSTKEILNATEATINLSIATGSELSQSAVVAASTIRGFGLDAKESTKIVDVMAESFTSSALDLEKFKTSMAISAPIAKNFGKDLEFTTAQLAVLADTGIDASTSGTSLRNIFLELSKRGLTWEEGLQKINDSTNKNVTALNLFGKRGATAAVILAENTEKASKLEKQFRNSAGAAKAMADIMQNNLAGDAVKAKSAIEGLYINIGKKLDPALRSITQGFTRFITKINESFSSLKQANKAIIEERNNVNLLVSKLTDANTKEGERLSIISKLNDISPTLVKNLNAEKIDTKSLADNLRAYNNELSNRIILLSLEEDEKKAASKLAKSRVKIAEKELEAIDLMNTAIRINQKYNKERSVELEKIVLSEGTVFEKLTKTRDLLNKGVENGNSPLTSLLDELSELDDKLKEQEKTNEDFTKRQLELKKILGIGEEEIIEEVTEIVKENNEEQIKSVYKINTVRAKKVEERLAYEAKETEEALDALIDENEDFTDELEKLNDKELADLADKLDKEIALEAAAQQKIIDDRKAKELEWAAAGKKIKEASIDAAGKIVSDRINFGIDEDLAAIQLGYETEQTLLDDKLDKGVVTEAEYAEKSADISKKLAYEEAKAAKKKALYDIAISTIVGIAKVIPNIPLMAVAAALGAAQAIAVSAEPLPKLEKGQVNIKGKRHSQGGIDVNVEAGESYINRTGTKNAPQLLTDINEGLIKDADILTPNKNKVFGADSKELYLNQQPNNIDLSELIKESRLTREEIRNRPEFNTALTDSGLITAYKNKEISVKIHNDWLHK